MTSKLLFTINYRSVELVIYFFLYNFYFQSGPSVADVISERTLVDTPVGDYMPLDIKEIFNSLMETIQHR